MEQQEWLAERFEQNRDHLRGVAYRMLGSLSEADDAIQEAWLRLSRSDADRIENLGGWLTTVVARVCLDMLRSRTSRREQSLDVQPREPAAPAQRADPEREALLADSVGLALMVVLDRLNPAERLAFVLHDLFAVSFEDIAPIVGRTPTATRQLASRARRRVQGTGEMADADLSGQRNVVDAFLSALRGGDVDALVALLDPDFLIRTDAAASVPGAPREVRGAREWAQQAIGAAKGAKLARLALLNGSVGAIVAPRGKLFRALLFTIVDGKIRQLEVVGEPERLHELDVAVLS